MTIRPSSPFIETQPISPQNSFVSREVTSSTYKIEPPLPQSTEFLKTEQVADAILATIQNENINSNQIIEPLRNEPVTAKVLLMKAIDLNPQDYKAYYKLAKALEDNETVQLLNGEFYTEKKLYLKAIDLNPTHAKSYYHLAFSLDDDETVQLLSGKFYTEKKLYIKAIDLDPTHTKSYYYLANLLEGNSGIQLLNDDFYCKKDLYIKVIKLDPTYAQAYFMLATFLDKDETMELNDKSYTQQELYLKTIDLYPTYISAYGDLAGSLDEDETIQLLNGESYTKKKLYIKIIDISPKHPQPCTNLAELLDEDETVQFLNGESYSRKELYKKAIDLYIQKIDLYPTDMSYYFSLGNLLYEDETVQFLNGELYTKKKLYLQAIELDSNKIITLTVETYLIEIYCLEIEKNPQNIESYFDLIVLLASSFRPFLQLPSITINKNPISIKSLIEKAFNLDPDLACSPRFAPVFFSAASLLHEESKSFLKNLEKNLTPQNLLLREMVLKQGISLTLKNNKSLYVKKLYQQALPFLSSIYLKDTKNKGVGKYLSHRKPILLQDGVKFTKLMAYVYAYQKRKQYTYQERKLVSLLIKIGDALHPEQYVTLNDKFYDKRDCYTKAHRREYVDFDKLNLSLAESLYPHEHVRKKELFSSVLESAYANFKDRWKAYTLLARILSQYELKGVESKYLLMFGNRLKSYKDSKSTLAGRLKKYSSSSKSYNKMKNNPSTNSIKNTSTSVTKDPNSKYNTNLDDTLYFEKKREFLLNLLTFSPSCEEAYVALATSFDDPLTIHKKSYPSKESLYLKAIDINSEYSLPYFLLGKELFTKKIPSIQLLNGVTLSCKQLLMRAIQLGTYQAEAYHLAALVMDDKDGVLLFDGETILSRGDLFIRAFERDSTRLIDLNNFIYHVKRNKKILANMSS